MHLKFMFLDFSRRKKLLDEFKPFIDEIKEQLFRVYDDEILSKTHRYKMSVEALNRSHKRDLMKFVFMFLYCLHAPIRSNIKIFTMISENNLTLYDTMYDAFMHGS